MSLLLPLLLGAALAEAPAVEAPVEPAAEAPPAEPVTEAPAAEPVTEAPAAEPMSTPGLELRRQARRPYPRRLYDDLSVERRCVVDVTVDDRGRAASITPVDCPEELIAWSTKRVQRDRWQRPVPAGARARVTVTYVPPASVAELPAPDYWRRRELGACDLRVVVDGAGRAVLVQDEEGCTPGLADWSPTPPGALDGKVPNVCPVTFLVTRGEVRGLDLFRCGLGVWGLVREGLDRWTWPAHDRPTPYSVQIQLVPAADAP